MTAASIAVSIVFALLLSLSAGGKFARQEMQMATMRRVGFPEDKVWLLASAELAGAAGLVAGLFWWRPFGIAAGAGLVLYFLGAIVSHLRKRELAIAGAGVMLALSVAALTLQS
jgi:hypothetical protein